LGHNRAAYNDPDVPVFLHAPRTGGHSRAAALQGAIREGKVAVASHNVQASHTRGLTFMFLRHPVDRFISAAIKRGTAIEDFVAVLRAERLGAGGTELLLRPQTWWLDREGVETYRLENMNEVWPELTHRLSLTPDLLNPLPVRGEPAANSGPLEIPVLTDEQRDVVMGFYAPDMVAWMDADGS
jgi:hypothetical protein